MKPYSMIRRRYPVPPQLKVPPQHGEVGTDGAWVARHQSIRYLGRGTKLNATELCEIRQSRLKVNRNHLVRYGKNPRARGARTSIACSGK